MRTFSRVLVAVAALACLGEPVVAAADTPAYSTAVDARMTLNADLTAVIDSTVRNKVFKEGAIRLIGQQTLSYAESTSRIEILEAHTEKADGRKVPLDPANILTRDAATGLNAVYQRDSKVLTLIFPDVEVGDTLVYVSRTHRYDKRIPGHFSFAYVLPSSVPYSAYRLTVEAPKSVGLRTHVRGEGLTHAQTEADDTRRQVFDYVPTAWHPEEPGAVSAWDRDAQLVITTVADMGQLGAGYWSSMRDKDIVAPEIAALADEITKGLESKRAQAEAIEAWVKKNVRYVLVYLGSGGMTPNPAPNVLKNKYGDCKDHVVLTSALLKAKGIASEQVLISTGSMYRLPELPVPIFNHVMLYLPEFGLYTDPTALSSAFSILPTGSYDKPVLHISDTGGRLARTPPMRAQDHTTTSKTRVTVEADGKVRGETRQVSRGVFASGARQTAVRIETQGREKYAESLLRSLGRPGTGRFEPATPSDLSEPYQVLGSFALDNKLQVPLSGQRDMPFGMPTHRRPGVWPLGQRIANRSTDFFCFATSEIEEIEITFAAGLSLPRKPENATIDTKHFSYRSTHAIEGRTLKVRREFTSKVPGQICARETESEITEPLRRVMRSLGTQMMFAPPQRGTTAL